MGPEGRLQCGTTCTWRRSQLGDDTTATDDREGLVPVPDGVQEVAKFREASVAEISDMGIRLSDMKSEREKPARLRRRVQQCQPTRGPLPAARWTTGS